VILLEEEDKVLIKKDLVLLPFVQFDRMVECNSKGKYRGYVLIYGWIKREDLHEDYVELRYIKFLGKENRRGFLELQFSTSSAEYTKEINKILFEDNNHIGCQRVEEVFDIENCIKLKGIKEERVIKND